MAQIEKILGQIPGGGFVVNGNPVGLPLTGHLLVGGNHHGNVGQPAQIADGHGDNAGDVLGTEQIKVFPLALDIIVAGSHQHGEIFLLALGLHALHQVAIEEVGDVGEDDADGVGGAGTQALGVEVGLVIGLLHHGQNSLAQLRRDGALAVDDLGNSGNTELVGNIANGGFQAASSFPAPAK